MLAELKSVFDDLVGSCISSDWVQGGGFWILCTMPVGIHASHPVQKLRILLDSGHLMLQVPLLPRR